jgi:myo-inositol-1(or 4)-monophosphatase
MKSVNILAHGRIHRYTGGTMIDFIAETSKAAGTILMQYFGSVKTLGEKAHERDIFTEADVASQKAVIAAIEARYPDHGIIAEEEGGTRNTDREWVWYIDPLDGTKNFATHTPLFGVIIAAAQHGTVKAAGVYLPVTGDLYTAEYSKGAYLNGTRIHCSDAATFSTTYGTGSMGIGGHALKMANALIAHGGEGAWNNAIGSAAVSAVWTAAGKRDWYISRGAHDWDYAGPSLILAEAGCTVTTIEGKPWQPGERSIVAANPVLHAFMINALKTIDFSAK